MKERVKSVAPCSTNYGIVLLIKDQAVFSSSWKLVPPQALLDRTILLIKKSDSCETRLGWR
jgi:hypothetical protein